MTVTDRIDRAVAQIILREPWYASLLLHLQRRELLTIPTIGVDGIHLFYNPPFIATLSENELLGVLLHETLHCALLHITRRGEREPLRWNIACDRVVNRHLTDAGYSLPVSCVPPTSIERVVEEEYLDQQLQHMQLGAPGRDLQESQTSKDDADTVSVQAIEHSWKEALVMAQGMTPAYLRRCVEAVLASKIPWQTLLASWLSARRRCPEHTWTRPSRRIRGLPGKRQEPMGIVGVVLDTSGSISPDVLSCFLSELQAILAHQNLSVYCLSADAQVHTIVVPGECLPPAWVGGGGTDFRPALTWAESKQLDAVVYFTDGYGTFPSSCEVPVCWVMPEIPPPPTIPVHLGRVVLL